MHTSGARFAASGRQVVALARDEAERLHHEYIGTEHLALALTLQTRGPAATALRNLHIDVAAVRDTVESIAPPGAGTPSPDATLPYTSRTQKAFALAKEAALAFGQGNVAAEHLLLGILREGKGIGAQVLLHHGLSEDALIDQIGPPTRGP